MYFEVCARKRAVLPILLPFLLHYHALPKTMLVILPCHWATMIIAECLPLSHCLHFSQSSHSERQEASLSQAATVTFQPAMSGCLPASSLPLTSPTTTASFSFERSTSPCLLPSTVITTIVTTTNPPDTFDRPLLPGTELYRHRVRYYMPL